MIKKGNNIFEVKLDEEEQEISHAIDKAIDRNELKSVDDLEKELALAKEAAANFLRKD